MTKARLIFAAIAASLVMGLAIPTLAQTSPPKIEKPSSSLVGSTTVLLSMTYNTAGLPSRGWFEVSTDAGMSGAKTYGQMQNSPTSSWTGFHSTVSGLTPATTYYFRGVISAPSGKAESSVASFKTSAASAPQPPTVSFQNSGYEGVGAGSYRVSFIMNGNGLGGTCYLLWSTNSSLGGAQRVGQQSFSASPTARGYHPTINISKLADKTVIYFEAVVETSAGTAKSGIKSVEIRNAPY